MSRSKQFIGFKKWGEGCRTLIYIKERKDNEEKVTTNLLLLTSMV
jgi:hypothetical protein